MADYNYGPGIIEMMNQKRIADLAQAEKNKANEPNLVAALAGLLSGGLSEGAVSNQGIDLSKFLSPNAIASGLKGGLTQPANNARDIFTGLGANYDIKEAARAADLKNMLELIGKGFTPYEQKTTRQTAEEYMGPPQRIGGFATSGAPGSSPLTSPVAPEPLQDYMRSGQLGMPRPSLKTPTPESLPENVMKLNAPIGGTNLWQKKPTEIDPYQLATLGLNKEKLVQEGAISKDKLTQDAKLKREKMALDRDLANLRARLAKQIAHIRLGGGGKLSPTAITNTIANLESKKAQLNTILADPVKSVMLDDNQIEEINASLIELDVQLEIMQRLQGRGGEVPTLSNTPTTEATNKNTPSATAKPSEAGGKKTFVW